MNFFSFISSIISGFLSTTALGLITFTPGAFIWIYLEKLKDKKQDDAWKVAVGLWFVFGAVIRFFFHEISPSCP